MDKILEMTDCDRCGEEFPISQMIHFPIADGPDGIDPVYYCPECNERCLANQMMHE